LSQGAKQRNKTEKQEAASPHSSPSQSSSGRSPG
jgi:hypothetical protein